MSNELTHYNTAPNPILYFTDNEGKPLANGTLRFRKATEHGVEKTVFKEYIKPGGETSGKAWEQPITLDAGGHAIDPTSGTIKPVYFSSDSNYYLDFRSFDSSVYYTEDDFNSPANRIIQQTSLVANNITNYILNSEFRFVPKTTFLSTESELPANTSIDIASEGWSFFRNNDEGTQTLEFKEFTPGDEQVPGNVRNYLYFEQTSFGAGGQTALDIRHEVGRVRDFSTEEAVISSYGASITEAKIEVIARQYFGTGGSPSATVDTPLGNFSFSGTYGRQVIAIPLEGIPSIVGKTLGTNDDDRFVLIFRMPLNQIFSLSTTKFQFNEGEVVSDYQYKTYHLDRIERNAYSLPAPTAADRGSTLVFDGSEFVLDAQTGTVLTSSAAPIFNGTSDPLYLLADGSTLERDIYVPATDDSVKYNRLYDFYENSSVTSDGNYYGFGTDGFKPMLYNDIASFSCTANFTDINAWSDNDTGFTIENARTGATTDFSSEYDYFAYFPLYGWLDHTHASAGEHQNKATNRILGIFRLINDDDGAVTAVGTGSITEHSALVVVQEIAGSVSSAEVTRIEVRRALGFYRTTSGSQGIARYWTFDTPSDAYYVYYPVDNIGQDPAPGGRTGIRIPITQNESEITMLLKTIRVLNEGTYGVTAEIPLFVTITNDALGFVTPSSQSVSSGITLIRDIQIGGAQVQQIYIFSSASADFITAGDYIWFYTTTTDYVLWVRKNGIGTAPAVGTIELPVDIRDGFSATDVGLAFQDALLGRALKRIQTVAASALSGGEYLLFENSARKFAGYIVKDGIGSPPSLVDTTYVPIPILGADTAVQVAQKLAKAVSSVFFQIPDYQGLVLRMADPDLKVDKEYEYRLPSDTQNPISPFGLYQKDSTEAHTHGFNGSNELGSAGYASSATSGSTDRYMLTHAINTFGSSETRAANMAVNFYIKV